MCSKIASLELVDARGNTPLLNAVISGDFEGVSNLLMSGADFTKVAGQGFHYYTGQSLKGLTTLEIYTTYEGYMTTGEEKMRQSLMSLIKEYMVKGGPKPRCSCSSGAVLLGSGSDAESFISLMSALLGAPAKAPAAAPETTPAPATSSSTASLEQALSALFGGASVKVSVPQAPETTPAPAAAAPTPVAAAAPTPVAAAAPTPVAAPVTPVVVPSAPVVVEHTIEMPEGIFVGTKDAAGKPVKGTLTLRGENQKPFPVSYKDGQFFVNC